MLVGSPRLVRLAIQNTCMGRSEAAAATTSTDGELAGPELAATSGRRVTEFMRPRSGLAARGAWGQAES
jgi:hypothetical protein